MGKCYKRAIRAHKGEVWESDTREQKAHKLEVSESARREVWESATREQLEPIQERCETALQESK